MAKNLEHQTDFQMESLVEHQTDSQMENLMVRQMVMRKDLRLESSKEVQTNFFMESTEKRAGRLAGRRRTRFASW